MKQQLRLSFSVAFLFFTHTALAAERPNTARVSSVDGRVTYSASPSGHFAPLTAGAELPTGSRIKTGSDGTALIVVVSGAAIRVSENSEVTIDAMSSDAAKRKALVSLKSGTVSALIDPKRSKQTDFKIQTPQGVAAARGTFYGVTVRKGKTFVGVKKGKVGVAHTQDDRS
ncbi:MAG TPA: FecR family protein [Chthoniobacteraceae bacterium]|nr:FecR family protein [Chthoniobacteraceae bacterium]